MIIIVEKGLKVKKTLHSLDNVGDGNYLSWVLSPVDDIPKVGWNDWRLTVFGLDFKKKLAVIYYLRRQMTLLC